MTFLKRAAACASGSPYGDRGAVFAGRQVLAVADGSGSGSAAGIASAIAVDAVAALDDEPIPLFALDAAVHRANALLRDIARQGRKLAGMRTSLTVLACSGMRVAVVHAGHTCAYLCRSGTLQQLTRAPAQDDAAETSQVDGSRVSGELDGGPLVQWELSLSSMKINDRFLICNGALKDVVDAAEIGEVLTSAADPDVAVGGLRELAYQAGARCRLSCIVADVLQGGSPDQDDGDALVRLGWRR
jgi:serine/threonine protein phosphatase PrpC